MHQHVVDAHGDQVNAYGVVHLPLKSEFQFRAHTVGAADQNGFFELFGHLKQRPKAANTCQYAFAHGFFGEWFDALYQGVARVNVNAGVFVAEGSGHGVKMEFWD